VPLPGTRVKKLETKVFAPSIRRFAPLSLTLVALGLSACGTTSSGPAQRIAVVEEDTQGTSSVNISSLSDVIQRNPNDPGAYNTRGAAYARLGRYSDAMSDFAKAVQIDPNFAPACARRTATTRPWPISAAPLRPIPITARPISAAPTCCGRRAISRKP
jgi:tetratricopeptide (TPR) repeat protein